MTREKPKPAVKALIERDEKILALKTRAGGEDYWVLPGGKIEYGETPEKALEREIEEEISCSVEIGDPAGMYHFFTGPDGEGEQVVLTAFEAGIGDQEVDLSDNPADENIVEYRWLEPREFMDRTVNDSLERLLSDHAFGTPKLVRDRIPEIMEDNGDEGAFRKVRGEEYMDFLLDKVVEEAEELRDSGSLEELADLLEAVDTFLYVSDTRTEDIEAERSRKADEKGGFMEGFVLEDLQ